MKYLARLKSEKRQLNVLPKLPKVETPTKSELPKVPKPPCDSFGSAEGRHFSEITPVLPGEADPTPKGRIWEPGWPYVCECGEATGWSTDGVGICPSCAAGPDP